MGVAILFTSSGDGPKLPGITEKTGPHGLR